MAYQIFTKKMWYALAVGQIYLFITREQNSLLKDSIIYLNERIAEQSIPHKTPQKRAHIYVVKKGDSFCRISRQLYGTEARYIEIVKLNNLNAKTILHEGDSLKVPEK